ncbi:MAG: ATP-dependent Clp protease ATP-binding subunit, partial [Candidatus Tectomicrobia bacterium]|nr:ATP-dependent Clp protease ATP-binding subunit [Candidatus Tectomicrobia bacterium]
MIELYNYEQRLTEEGRKALKIAIEDSQSRGHYYLGVEHLFLAITKVEKELFNRITLEFNLNPDQIIQSLHQHLSVPREYLGGGVKVSPNTKSAFKTASDWVEREGKKSIGIPDLLIAIFKDPDSIPAKIFRDLGIEPYRIIDLITGYVRELGKREADLRKKYELPPYLKHFGTNLNRLARLDKIPPLIGRDRELSQMMEILCHVERSNSVMLIGEPGVGKTAMAEGLARKIELEPDTVPFRLRECQIVNLQMNTMVAGTMFRGMFEDRIERIINEVKERQNIILFID